MSQSTNSVSAANAKSNNRIYLTARSLLQPTTTFIGWAIGGSFLFSLIAVFAYGMSFMFSIFAMACCLGLGHMTALFQKSERRRLVPGMNETCAAVAIAATMAFWLVNCVLILYTHGWIPEAYGLSLFLICYGTWMGWGERRIFHFLVFLFFVILAVIVVPKGPERIYEFYKGLSISPRTMVAAGIGLGGLCMLWRFWTLATLKINPAEFKQKKDLFSFLTDSQVDQQRSISPASERDGGSSSVKGAVAPAKLPASFATRMQWMLYGRVYWNGFYYFWGLVSVGILLSVLILARGEIEATVGFTIFACILLALSSGMALVRLPQAFRRIWLSGLSENRSQTARHVLKLAARRVFTFAAIVFALLLIQAPMTADWYVTILFMLLVATSLSGIGLWIATKWYAFWSDKMMVVLLAIVCIAAALVSLTPFAFEWIVKLNEAISSFGMAYSLAAIGLVTVLIWAGCLFDGANSLGKASELMECEVSQLPGSAFNMEVY